MRTIPAALALVSLLLLSGSSPGPSQEKLAEALRQRLSLGSTPVGHCRYATPRPSRSATGWERCESRLGYFSRYFLRSGAEHGVDPWLLAAMAIRESGLSPWAIGGLGEGGIMQLHPSSRASHGIRFVHDPRYRRWCRARPGNCQADVVDAGARHLRAWLDRCGSQESALGGYNSGSCTGGRRYIRRVLVERSRLLELAGDVATPVGSS